MNKNKYPICKENIEIINSCPVCENQNIHSITSVSTLSSQSEEEYVNFFETSVCNGCGLVFRNIRPNQTWYQTSRSWNQHSHVRSNSRPTDRTNFANKYADKTREEYNRYENLCNTLSQLNIHKGRVLDIGCGFGSGSVAFQEQGWDVTGLEPASHKIDYNETFNRINVVQGTIEDNPFPKNSFDLVILSHTLEHLWQPLKSLSIIRDLLSEKGYLYIEVPNVFNFVSWYDTFYLPHLVNFNQDNLAFCVAKSGFKPLWNLEPKNSLFGIRHLGIISQVNSHEIENLSIPKRSVKIDRISELYLRNAPSSICKIINNLSKIPKLNYFVPTFQNWTRVCPNRPLKLSINHHSTQNELAIKFILPTTQDIFIDNIKLKTKVTFKKILATQMPNLLFNSKNDKEFKDLKISPCEKIETVRPD